MNRILVALVVSAWFAGCYYSPDVRPNRSSDSVMSEADAQSLVSKKFAPYGISFIFNVKMVREKQTFIIDGYDRNLRIGFEYRSHEEADFADDDEDEGKGAFKLTDARIDMLQKRQDVYREYFLIVPEGPREEVEGAVEKFVEDLYAWEVLKKVKPKESSKDKLFPEADKEREKDLLPWEATGDVKKKRKELEEKEPDRTMEQKDEGGGDEMGGSTEKSGDDEALEKGSTDDSKDEDEPATKPEKKEKKEDEIKDEDF